MKKIVPDMLSTVFVPFLTMLVMIPVTAFLIGPIGVCARQSGPPAGLKEWPRPEAHCGKFADSARSA